VEHLAAPLHWGLGEEDTWAKVADEGDIDKAWQESIATLVVEDRTVD
jgi:hypothetical protein